MPELPPLPGVLQDVERITSRDAAILLALHLGGRDVYFSARFRSTLCDRVPALRPSEADTICDYLAGQEIHVPLANEACGVWLLAAFSVVEVAARLRVSRRTVWRWRVSYDVRRITSARPETDSPAP